MPYGIFKRLGDTLMVDENDSLDAASEIEEAMISSLAEVVKNVEIENTQEDISVDATESDEVTNDEDNVVDDELETTVTDIVNEGEAAHRSGDYDNALELFNKAIALDPSNAMAWFNRGVLLESKQDTKGAKQSFVICLDIDPNHGPALANLAVLLNRLGDNDGAVEIANRALEFFPGHPYLVNILEENKKAGGIVNPNSTVLPTPQEKLVEQNLTPASSELVSELFDDEDDITEEHVEEIIEESDITETPEVEDGIDLDAICNEATLLLSQGEAKSALQLLKPYLHAEASSNFTAWKIAAGAMASMTLDDHAISAYNHAIGLNPEDAKSFFNLGALHERKGNVESAIKCFNSALELDGEYEKAATRLISLSENANDIEGLILGRRCLANLGNGRSEYATFLVELAEGEASILENTNGLPPTIPAGPSLANEAMEYCDEGSEIMARALSAAGRHTEAVKTWKMMIQSDKTNPDLWTGLAKSLESAGDIGSAQKCHEKAQSLTVPQVENAGINNTLQIDQGEANLPEAAPSSDSVPLPTVHVEEHQAAPQTPLPELTVAPVPQKPVAEHRPEIDLAAAALEATANMERNRTFEANSNSIANQDIEWYNKGIALIEDKKYREALSCFDRALPSFANNDEMVIRILNGRGNALYYLEEYPKCVESYHKAMVINPKGVQGKTLYNMGTAYAEMQRFTDAIKCFEQAIPRGLDKSQQKLAKEQIRRCNILLKEQQRKMN